jgi:hypothetical protein
VRGLSTVVVDILAIMRKFGSAAGIAASLERPSVLKLIELLKIVMP